MSYSHSSTTTLQTDQASRYLQQICKHWAHNLEVSFMPSHGTIVFPRNARGAEHPGDALMTLMARDGMLTARINATSAAQLEGLKGALERHLERFAFREAPLQLEWTNCP